jgi:hypothetical protein
MLGKIFLLTLFDFDWIDVPWMPDLFKTQFSIAVVISIAFPLGASKYHNFLEGSSVLYRPMCRPRIYALR